MKILVTGAAGFIGSSLIQKLLELNFDLIGIDNLNDYYDKQLKIDRLNKFISHSKYKHYYTDISNQLNINSIFSDNKPDIVVNLAAQAGVRYSLENPYSYIQSNIVGFSNVIECSKNNNVRAFIYASSSSVYGLNSSKLFSLEDPTDSPASLYAATKKSNELIAHSYSNIYKMPTFGLRFFTVYGPWGRPDMALFKFTKNIISGDVIDLYNCGNHSRDFTYIDDIVDGLVNLVLKTINFLPYNYTASNISHVPFKIFNMGNQSPVKLIDFVNIIESELNIKAKFNYLPLQPGDVADTNADIFESKKYFAYHPKTSIKVGVRNFVNWYLEYYNIKQ